MEENKKVYRHLKCDICKKRIKNSVGVDNDFDYDYDRVSISYFLKEKIYCLECRKIHIINNFCKNNDLHDKLKDYYNKCVFYEKKEQIDHIKKYILKRKSYDIDIYSSEKLIKRFKRIKFKLNAENEIMFEKNLYEEE